ncbi:MAG: PEP-CTERM sorting domain-containing protein [Phormidesmis sp. RL_2_1]|nr:PEP-CTERM sorting domain-containing protein [Phormidesmis sp. RL_2_1]
MKTNQFSALIYAGVVATTLGVLSQPADAFVITNTSATWDNVTVTGGGIIGSGGTAANDTNMIKFLNADGMNQVRWGESVYKGHYEDNWELVTRDVQVQKTRQVRVPVYNNRGKLTGYKTETQSYYETVKKTEWVNNKVWVAPTYKNQSGLGYKGVSNLDLAVGEVFNIGTLTHFNQTIFSGNFIGTKADFSLVLDFGDVGIGSQKFDFAFSIDETRNNQGNNNNGKDCPYQTDAGKGCSDKITWDFAIDQKNSFTYNNEKYSLELVGFAQSLANQNLVNDFISQEYTDNSASLFARLVKIDTTQDIPEPTSLLGLAGLGLFFAHSRKKKSEESVI